EDALAALRLHRPADREREALRLARERHVVAESAPELEVDDRLLSRAVVHRMDAPERVPDLRGDGRGQRLAPPGRDPDRVVPLDVDLGVRLGRLQRGPERWSGACESGQRQKAGGQHEYEPQSHAANGTPLTEPTTTHMPAR